MDFYFSDRERGVPPRTIEEIHPNVWGGIFVLIEQRISNGAFGSKYPMHCQDDDNLVVGCDKDKFYWALKAEFPTIEIPLSPTSNISTPEVLDLIEFCFHAVAEPVQSRHHPYFDHYHLHFNVEQGQQNFIRDVERIFTRNSLAFELTASGKFKRITSTEFSNILTTSIFRTGDKELDDLLNKAREKYYNTRLDVRKESLEKLWDAWERLKSRNSPSDKRESIKILLQQACADNQALYDTLDKEANELTKIGNDYRIRHHEVNKISIETSELVDYFFQRMFSMINLILVKTTPSSYQVGYELNTNIQIDNTELPF